MWSTASVFNKTQIHRKEVGSQDFNFINTHCMCSNRTVRRTICYKNDTSGENNDVQLMLQNFE